MFLIAKLLAWIPEFVVSLSVSMTGSYLAHTYLPALHASFMLYSGFLFVIAGITFTASYVYRMRQRRVRRERLVHVTNRPRHVKRMPINF